MTVSAWYKCGRELMHLTTLLKHPCAQKVAFCRGVGFDKSRLLKRRKKSSVGAPVPLGSPLLCDAATPVLCVFFVVRPLLPPAGAVQLLQPLLCTYTEYFTTGVMAVAGVEMVLCIIVVLLNTYKDIHVKDIDPTCVRKTCCVACTCTNMYKHVHVYSTYPAQMMLPCWRICWGAWYTMQWM